MSNPPHLNVVPLVVKGEDEPSYTQSCMDALAAAQEVVSEREGLGKPVTHLVVCMISEYEHPDGTAGMWHEDVQNYWCSDLAAIGVMDLCKNFKLTTGA